jgi:hypothetical protein
MKLHKKNVLTILYRPSGYLMKGLQKYFLTVNNVISFEAIVVSSVIRLCRQ